jgi:hypothetical protein
MRRPRLAAAAALTGIGAVLAAGYVAAGTAGLVDVASVVALGVLVAARGTLRGEKPPSVRPRKIRQDPAPGPALRAADFPAFAKIASDLEWAQLSRRDYEHLLRPRLARLAAALDAGPAADLAGRSAADPDGPGIDRATLELIVSRLERRVEP